MTTTLIIALFIATQAPTPKNCTKLSQEMVKLAQQEGNHNHFQQDLEDIRAFVANTCKDGYVSKVKAK